MSAPNVDKPNEGLLGQAANSVGNAANFVGDKINQAVSGGQKEASKEQAKGNTGDGSLLSRAEGAKDAIGHKVDESTYKGSAKANKEGI